MDDSQIPADSTQAPPAGDALMARMARLRENAARERSHADLVDGVIDARRQPRRVPWRIVGAGAGVLVVGVIALLVVLQSNSGGGGTTPPANGAAPGGDAQPPSAEEVLSGAPTASPKREGTGASATAGATTTPGDTPEGAIAVSELRAVNFGEPPEFLPPAAERVRIAEGFGTPRGEGYVHSGDDLAPLAGTEMRAVAVCDGKVLGSYEMDGFGTFVVVDCGGNWRSVQAQLTSVSVKAGDQVTAGVSELGRASGTMHFELRWTGVPVDPQTVMDVMAAPGPRPTPTVPPTDTPVPTAKPSGGNGGGGGGGGPKPSDTPVPGATPVPTNAPPTSTPTPAPPTATPTSTATQQPPSPTPTPTRRPVIR